ncbi:MAG TPA: hypothetical protein VJP76_07330 [Candidatus Tumulicola sp.]|nr:hypothetical protein [Candidatus Tumulicola sp.]
MKKHLLVALAASAFLFATLAPALAIVYDGKLPLYPHATIFVLDVGKPKSYWPTALRNGDPSGSQTTDSVAVVTAWYRAHLPGYSLHTSAEGAVFSGPGGLVHIASLHGKTIIGLNPS